MFTTYMLYIFTLTMKITIVWVVAGDKLETFLKCLSSGDPTANCA